jgi:hypothetical protein
MRLESHAFTPRGLITFIILYVASRESDEPVEMRRQASPSLDHAIATATNSVRNMVFARGKGHAVPIGFIIESPEGDELYRWYDETPVYGGSLR